MASRVFVFFLAILPFCKLVGNDHFADRTLLTGPLPARVSSDLTGASGEDAEPWHGSSKGNPTGLPKSRWFAWTPEHSGWFEIRVESDAPLILSIYTGDEIQRLQLLRDAEPLPGFPTRLQFQASAGLEYQIAVASDDQGSPPFDLVITEVPERPANDDFADHVEIEGTDHFLIDATTAGASAEPAEPASGLFRASASVWWSYAPTTTQAMVVEWISRPGQDFPEFPGRVTVYTGTKLQDLTSLGSFDDRSSTGTHLVFQAEVGKSYFICYDDDGWGPSPHARGPSRVRMQLRPLASGPGGRPANDDFGGAIDLTGLDEHLLSAGMRFATREPGEPNHVAPHVKDPEETVSAWWFFVPSESANYFVSSASSLAVVYEVRPDGALRRVDTDQVFTAEANTRYYVALVADPDFLRRTTGCSCQGTISKDPVLLESSFGKASAASHPSREQAYQLEDAETISLPLSRPASDPDFYWQWTVPASGSYRITTPIDPSRGDHFSLFTGLVESDENLLQPLFQDEDRNAEPIYQLEAGQEVLMRLSRDTLAEWNLSSLKIELLPAPVNDHFARASSLTENISREDGLTLGSSTLEEGEPDTAGAGSLWWRWTAPSAGNWDFMLSHQSDAQLDLFRGTTLANLTPVEDSVRTVTVAEGEEIHLRVSGARTIPIELRFQKQRTTYHNLRTNAADLGRRLPISSLGVLARATSEENEPGQRNVWWHWTAPQDKFVRVACNGSLRIYQGSPAAPFEQLTILGDDLNRDNKVEVISVTGGDSYLFCLFSDAVTSSPSRDVIRFSLEPAPDLPGNHFASRITLGNEKSAGFRGSASRMTPGYQDPDFRLNDDDTMWLTWQCPASGPYRITLETFEGYRTDGFILYVGKEVDQLTVIDTSDEDDEPTFVEFQGVAGTDYQIALDLERPLADFKLQIFPPFSYEAWLESQLNWIPGFYSVPSDARDRDDDRFGDGISNFTRYVYDFPAIDLPGKNNERLPALTEADGFLRLQYRIGRQASQATAIPIRHEGQVSLDGKNWTAITPISLGDRRFLVETPVTGQKKFLRVRAWEER